ncbi:hypothetical protein [Brachyspira intermedia]|uniref:hypothetical protein n=1 Tax=Brachyspira intermedia TaxID=84377 RepID=UPI0002E4973E|nr:hypothetical protein [Brachyspira intermedia]
MICIYRYRADVKIPLAGSRYFRESSGGYTSQGYDYKKLKNTFKNPYIPYVKDRC